MCVCYWLVSQMQQRYCSPSTNPTGSNYIKLQKFTSHFTKFLASQSYCHVYVCVYPSVPSHWLICRASDWWKILFQYSSVSSHLWSGPAVIILWSNLVELHRHWLVLSYSEALEKSGLVRLDTRREDITQSTFMQVNCPTHPLVTPLQGFHFSDDIKADLPLFSSKV